jgi:hypothetical protein
MALTDWEISKSDTGISVGLETISPIRGTKSLRISQGSITDSVGISTVTLRSNVDEDLRGFTTGRVRTLLKPIQINDTTSTRSLLGVCGMMNQANVWKTGGACYVAGRWQYTMPSWVIGKIANGVSGVGSIEILASGNSVNLPNIGEAAAIEFEWIYNLDELGGVRLILRAGTNVDFSDIKNIYSVVDSVNPLSTSVGEGIFVSDLETTGNEIEVLYDNTVTIELIPRNL